MLPRSRNEEMEFLIAVQLRMTHAEAKADLESDASDGACHQSSLSSASLNVKPFFQCSPFICLSI